MQCFFYDGALSINKARIEHCETLGIDFAGKTVLETGCGGKGDFTRYLLSKGARVILNDSRPENIQSLTKNIGAKLLCSLEDLNSGDIGVDVDIVFSYGTLYHLHNPEHAIRMFAQRSRMCLIETIVNQKENGVEFEYEDIAGLNQSSTGIGCRPSRQWMLDTLRKHFKCAYISATQPEHEEFPTNWTASPNGKNTRAIFIASHDEVPNLEKWISSTSCTE